MTAVRHSSNAGRNRARLISTPTGRDAMSTTIAGVKFSDQLAALLDHAIAHGFRVEPDTRTKGAGRGNVVAYPPDKTHSPITFSEKGAKFNRAHYENLRREFYRAGCPPLPGDEKPSIIAASSREEALAQLPDGARLVEVGHLLPDDDVDLDALLRDEEEGPMFLGKVVESIAGRAGLGSAETDLMGILNYAVMTWAQKYSPDRIGEASANAHRSLEATYQKQIDEALRMAADHEATAVRATKALDKAHAAEKQARDDCAAALRRAEAAEAQARELEAAIAPLRSLLGKTAS